MPFTCFKCLLIKIIFFVHHGNTKCRKKFEGKQIVTRERIANRKGESEVENFWFSCNIFVQQIEAKIQIIVSNCRVLLSSAFRHIYIFFIISSSIYAVVIEWHNDASGTQSTFFSRVCAELRVLVDLMCMSVEHVILTCYTSVCPASIIYLVLFVNL